MSDDVPTPSKAVYLLFEFVSLAFVFPAAEAWLKGEFWNGTKALACGIISLGIGLVLHKRYLNRKSPPIQTEHKDAVRKLAELSTRAVEEGRNKLGVLQLRVLLQEGETLFDDLEMPNWGIVFSAPETESWKAAKAWAAKVESEFKEIGKPELIYEFGRLSDEAPRRLQPNPKNILSHRAAAEWMCHRIEQLKKIVCTLPGIAKQDQPTVAAAQAPQPSVGLTFEEREQLKKMVQNMEKRPIAITAYCEKSGTSGYWSPLFVRMMVDHFKLAGLEAYNSCSWFPNALPLGVSIWWERGSPNDAVAGAIISMFKMKGIDIKEVTTRVNKIDKTEIELMIGEPFTRQPPRDPNTGELI